MTNEHYTARLKRFEDAVALRGPDRVPVVPINVHFFDTNAAGVSNKDAMCDFDNRYKIWKDFVLEYDFDMAPALGTFPAQLLELLEVKNFKWSGGDLPNNQPFQYVEKEFMLQEDYNHLLTNPADFTCRVLWPRKARALEPFSKLPPLTLVRT